MTKATPFLMFQHGKAQAALDFYVEIVPGSRIVSIERFGAEGPGPEGTVLRAYVEIAGQSVMAHDSFITHGFDFTPSWSFFLDCTDEAETDRLFAALSESWLALPAVTLRPSCTKSPSFHTVLSPASASAVVPGRMPSSRMTVIVSLPVRLPSLS